MTRQHGTRQHGTRQHGTRQRGGARQAASTAAVLAAAALALAGCKSSSSASGGGSSSSGGSSSAASSASSGGSGGSGGSGSGGTTAATFFPIGVGNTWVYHSSLGGKNSLSVDKMTKVVQVSGGQKVTMDVASDVGKSDGVRLTYVFHSNGSISVPLTSLGSGSFELKSGSLIWPSAAQLASRKPHRSTLVFTTKFLGVAHTSRAHITVVGGGTQTVTVPAGTYHAQLIDESFTEKVSGTSVTVSTKTWVAPGVGPVKTEVQTSGLAGTSATEVLKSFTKG